MHVVDRNVAQNVLGGLPVSIVSVVLNGFELDVRRLTKIMLKAAHAGDIAAYCHAAHALADTAMNIGAAELALMARSASQRSVPAPDLPLVLAGESAIGELKTVCAL
jgi:hypothetical protein